MTSVSVSPWRHTRWSNGMIASFLFVAKWGRQGCALPKVRRETSVDWAYSELFPSLYPPFLNLLSSKRLRIQELPICPFKVRRGGVMPALFWHLTSSLLIHRQVLQDDESDGTSQVPVTLEVTTCLVEWSWLLANREEKRRPLACWNCVHFIHVRWLLPCLQWWRLGKVSRESFGKRVVAIGVPDRWRHVVLQFVRADMGRCSPSMKRVKQETVVWTPAGLYDIDFYCAMRSLTAMHLIVLYSYYLYLFVL